MESGKLFTLDQDEPRRDSASLELENIGLREENQRLLEQLRQKIYDIQREKESVRLRLITVEGDYDAQMKELQLDILCLREEVHSQKCLQAKNNLNHQEAFQALTDKNFALEERLHESNSREADLNAQTKELQQQLASSRASIQTHVQQLESLKAEISLLKETKISLEKKLQSITEERDCLLNALSDAQQTTVLLQRENANQQMVLTHQDNELAKLQEAAAILKDQLETLGQRSSPRHCPQQASTSSRTMGTINNSSHPHQSLQGELAGALSNGLQDHWWYKHVFLDPSMSEFYEDDGIEIDDEFLAMSSNLPFTLPDSVAPQCAAMEYDSEEVDAVSPLPNSSSYSEFMNDFKTEVADIYQQLRQMCVDFSAQSSVNITGDAGNNLERSMHCPGDWTPDQLALVEWDFRLASLRNVLTDLRYLLQDLVTHPPAISEKQLSSSFSDKLVHVERVSCYQDIANDCQVLAIELSTAIGCGLLIILGVLLEE